MQSHQTRRTQRSSRWAPGPKARLPIAAVLILTVCTATAELAIGESPTSNTTVRSTGDINLDTGETYSLDQLRRERKQLAQRKRRMVFNNDGDDLWKEPDSRRQAILDRRTTNLADSHVDAIWYWGSDGFKLIFQDENSHFARLYTMDPTGMNYKRAARAHQILMDDCGQDNLEIMIDFCREHGKEILYSNRW